MSLFVVALIDGGFDTLAIVKLKTENAVIVCKPAYNKDNILTPFSPSYDYIEVVKEKTPEGIVLHLHIPHRLIGQIDIKAFRNWYNGVLNFLQEIADNPQPLCQYGPQRCEIQSDIQDHDPSISTQSFSVPSSKDINQPIAYFGQYTVYDINGRKL
ncbi:MAG: hypothetical protein ABIL67_07240 [candidate division WOR-3 bacterium]